METKEHKKESTKTDWKGLVQGFVTNLFERIGDNVSQRVHTFVTKLKKRTIGAILMLIGGIFFLVSIAIFINTLFSDMFPWIGWSLVGFAVIATGYVVSKEQD